MLKFKEIKCTRCSNIVRIDSMISSVVCPDCVIKEQISKFGMPAGSVKVIKTDNDGNEAILKPRGWHFMAEFVDSEGNYYQKGKLIEANTDKPQTIIEEKEKQPKKKKEKGRISLQILKNLKEIQKLKNKLKSKSISISEKNRIEKQIKLLEKENSI